MSLPQFFLDEQVLSLERDDVFELSLSDADLKHARVLRLRAGEHIAVVDADSDYFECEIVKFDARDCMYVSISGHACRAQPAAEVFLAQGLAKGTKIDEVIRHATELGVAGFIPLKCARSVLKLDAKQESKKLTRWASIAKSAAMQSGQMRVPNVYAPVSIQEFCASVREFDAVCVCWEEASSSVGFHEALADVLPSASMGGASNTKKIAVVIGPEGGLERTEVEALLDCNDNAHLVSLGSSILRTETAGVVASAIALYELGMLGGKVLGGSAVKVGSESNLKAASKLDEI